MTVNGGYGEVDLGEHYWRIPMSIIVEIDGKIGTKGISTTRKPGKII